MVGLLKRVLVVLGRELGGADVALVFGYFR